ncbi:uncharacterized protein FIBRA_03158 [Fibroporia radiculosa]|uniref:F-box domain-containing protein n=1 Tax=Fibroporia radiculosa TaxID=599839 RepID=J4GNB7_9APHY|nr:uncharacterized protein FIBRA_03158 [Fibroporia radiculosa]CCM01110.1 predicted protein [Fibroporia radiculosa]
MSADAPLVFSNLPTELLRDIFEHAAVADIITARALSLVSSAVHHWTDPILYRTVVLSSARDLRSFLSAISHKPADFVRTRVKHLGIFALGPVQSIDRVLSACRDVQSLACGFHLPGYKQVRGCDALQALQRSREQHLLGLSCRDGWDTALVGPSVTHLRIHLTSCDAGDPNAPFGLALGTGSPSDSGWERLIGLSALTHLAIVYRYSPKMPADAILSALQQLLLLGSSPSSKAAPPRFQLILIQVLGSTADRSSTDATVELINKAVVQTGGSTLRIVAESAPASVVRQWETAVRGGPSIWESAEEVVKTRLATAAKKTNAQGGE